jgi:uncharacterized protein
MTTPLSRVCDNGLTVSVRVTPNASRDAIGPVEERAGASLLKVYVRAVPEDGKANAAVAQLLAAFLDCPKRSAVVTVGHTSRTKTITIDGCGPTLQRRLNDKLGSPSS